MTRAECKGASATSVIKASINSQDFRMRGRDLGEWGSEVGLEREGG